MRATRQLRSARDSPEAAIKVALFPRACILYVRAVSILYRFYLYVISRDRDKRVCNSISVYCIIIACCDPLRFHFSRDTMMRMFNRLLKSVTRGTPLAVAHILRRGVTDDTDGAVDNRLICPLDHRLHPLTSDVLFAPPTRVSAHQRRFVR